MSSITAPSLNGVPSATLVAIVDILVVAFLIYQFLMIVRGRRAAHILAGFGVVVILYVLSLWLGLELLRSILANLAPYSAFALIVMFQSEIRRLLARMGRHRFPSFGSKVQRRGFAEEIILAVQQLSLHKTGALIVIEQDIGLRTFVESGVTMDACVSRDLLLSIFHPNTALHDGAVIVQGDRIAAAACFLPLTMNPAIVGKMGTRHRAAIGITEETDCLAIVVSEETGRISLANLGELHRDLTVEQLENLLQHRPAGGASRDREDALETREFSTRSADQE